MDVHPDCASLAFLLGTWKGAGAGDYPTIEAFRYHEEVSFGHVGKPFFSYSQRTRDAETAMPLHAETGYLRAIDDGLIELVVVQPSGIVEIHTGVVVGQRLDLSLHRVETTPTAKSVTDVRREIRVDASGDSLALTYDVYMAAVGQPLTHHLHAVLNHQPPGQT